MTDSGALEWASIPARQLSFWATLRSGQTFRWHSGPSGDWLGVIGDSAVRIRACEDGFWWQTYPVHGRWEIIHRYFALDVDVESLYLKWKSAEPRIGPAIEKFSGLRILRQEPSEAFFSFLCASCNTIVKITRTIQALERRAGEAIVEIDGQVLYRFPKAERIAEVAESDLRSDLWGYRAPRLIDLARHMTGQGAGWLDELGRAGYESAHGELSSLYGIGAKIADCICLFGLGHDQAVPIDTHIRRIATDLFSPRLRHRTLTPSIYVELQDLFRDRFGAHAGWAQQYLFLEDLRQRDDETNYHTE
jgi:N-glycosylase/DNA lyase